MTEEPNQASDIEPGKKESTPPSTRRTRIPRSFPASSFLEALPLAEAIQHFAAGQKIRRLTLMEQLGRSAESSTSRQLIVNSGQYGLTNGGYKAEYLELTPKGAIASSAESNDRAKIAARLDLAIAKIEPFSRLYERFKDNRLPAQNVLRDAAVESGISEDRADECVETFLANVRDLGLLQTIAGAERLISFEMLLEKFDSIGSTLDEALPLVPDTSNPVEVPKSPSRVLAEASDFSDVCFLVTPIGATDSEQRRHADLVFGSLLEPALSGLGLRLVRSDKISQPGMITAQVIEHLVRSALVIADLSFSNPNVFYELALRHSTRKPVVQIARTVDPLPFDVNQARTIVLDMTSIYSFVPHIESHRAEIKRQARAALDNDGPADSPLSLFYPAFWDTIFKP